MNGYKLTKIWFDFAKNNLDKVECKHTATYFYIVELFNQNDWVDVIGLPTDFTMIALNIKSYKTYKKIIDDLEHFKFIKFIERSKNVFTSNKIALVKNTKATPKVSQMRCESYTKATTNAKAMQSQSDSTITKLINNKLINHKTYKLINDNYKIINEKLEYWLSLEEEEKIDTEIYPTFDDFWNAYDKKVGDKTKIKKLYSDIDLKTRIFLVEEHIPKYKESQPDKKYRKNPLGYLEEKKYNDEIIPYNNAKQNNNNQQGGASQSFREKTAKRLGYVQSE